MKHIRWITLVIVVLVLGSAHADGGAPSADWRPTLAALGSFRGSELALGSASLEVTPWRQGLSAGGVVGFGGRFDATWDAADGWLPVVGASLLLAVTEGGARFFVAPGWTLLRSTLGESVTYDHAPTLTSGVTFAVIDGVGLRFEGSVVPGRTLAGLSLGLEVRPWR